MNYGNSPWINIFNSFFGLPYLSAHTNILNNFQINSVWVNPNDIILLLKTVTYKVQRILGPSNYGCNLPQTRVTRVPFLTVQRNPKQQHFYNNLKWFSLCSGAIYKGPFAEHLCQGLSLPLSTWQNAIHNEQGMLLACMGNEWSFRFSF
jgi:hypothetical protein